MKKILVFTSLCCLTVLFSSFYQSKCDFVGDWHTDFGFLTIKEKNGTYSGSYPVNYGTGYITGKMSKDRNSNNVILKGTWQEGKASGKFEFKLDCYKMEFKGTWTNDNLNEKGTWNGMKFGI